MSFYEFVVSTRDHEPSSIIAPNWLVALGMALQEAGLLTDLRRLACEVLPNGTVIAIDGITGRRVVVSSSGDDLAAPEGEGEDNTANRPIASLGDDTVSEGPPGRELRNWRADLLACATLAMAAELAVSAALESVPAEVAEVLLRERGVLRYLGGSGPLARKLVGSPVVVGGSALEHVYLQGRPVILRDVQRDPRHLTWLDQHTGIRTRNLVACPIFDSAGPVGIVQLRNLPRPATDLDLDLVQEVAHVLGRRFGA